MMRSNALFAMVWFAVLAAVMLISLFYEFESTSFYGIAETRELVANSENAVEIKRIDVIEGQNIIKGELMVEAGSPDLILKINQISHQIDQLRLERGVGKAELKSKIDQLRAQKESKRSEINARISALQNQIMINKSLTAGLKSLKTDLDQTSSNVCLANPVQMKIDSLKAELKLALQPIDIQIEFYQKELDASDSPLKIRIKRLEKELELVKAENKKLNIYAPISGVIGSINYKSGEKVEPFAPILTLHTKNPLFIKGFINENAYTKIIMGDELSVQSVSDGQRNVSGKVVGVGSRIVEYPVRLRKRPDFKLWGREIMIRMPQNNPFILGEKVMIGSTQSQTLLVQNLKKLFHRDQNQAQVKRLSLQSTPEFKVNADKG